MLARLLFCSFDQWLGRQQRGLRCGPAQAMSHCHSVVVHIPKIHTMYIRLRAADPVVCNLPRHVALVAL
jgi:hypothetical protein